MEVCTDMKKINITIHSLNQSMVVEAIEISRQWAVHQARYSNGDPIKVMYSVTFIPTGLSVGSPVSKDVAVALARELAKRQWPEDLESFLTNSREMIELRKYARDVMLSLNVSRLPKIRVSEADKKYYHQWMRTRWGVGK